MAVENESRRTHSPVKTSSREAAERAAQLAPPEEQARRGATRGEESDGALGLDTGALKIPAGLQAEAAERDQSLFHLEPVVLFILILSLAFIAFIAYLISITPPAK
jgi:hypothetical protein